MDEAFTLTITLPAGDLVEHGRHFNVQGDIRGPVPDDARLTVMLLDAGGQVLRHVSTDRKNDRRLWTGHPDLTAYRQALDPGFLRMMDYGFPELLVRDPAHPEESMRDATIKCWYSDCRFKAMIVSATGPAQGMIFDDGIGFLDENGQPYSILPPGAYGIRVTLADRDGRVLAQADKPVAIGFRRDQAIVRINPAEHRENMLRWCQSAGISMCNETLPGYLEPYLGIWAYHMGLLPLYRACDAALYVRAHVHMFVYLIDPASTSYETELAFLQTQGAVEDPDRFTAYHYDIGEALVGKGRPWERRGRIVPFEAGRFLALCRVDLATPEARENVYDLSGAAVLCSLTELENLQIPAGSVIAVAGVIRPWQLDPASFILRPDNTYAISDGVCALRYTLDDGQACREETRAPGLRRIDGEPIGDSVYEFYNLFSIGPEYSGKALTIRVTACDRSGPYPGAEGVLRLRVL